MSETKTAADAPAMAREMIEAQRDDGLLVMPAFDKGRIALINRWLKAIQAIAALPPAPLPADVAAELAAFRALAKQAHEHKAGGYDVLLRLADADDLAAMHKEKP